MRDDIGKFRNERLAYDFVETQLWPDGPVCPHCGANRRIGRLEGQSTRTNTYKCYACCKPFTVKLGTIFEASKVPMYKWLQLILLHMAAGAELNPHKASVVLGVTPKTATTMLKRIRGR